MPTISAENQLATIIIVFDVKPENQLSLIDAARNNSQNVMEKKAGFVSASLHKSFDGNSVANYAQWDNHKSYDQAINFLSPDEVKIGEKIFELGEADWNVYKLAFTVGEKNTTISKDANVATVINVFSVEPQNQAKILEILQRLGKIVETQRGIISANVHKSFDGKRVATYAQWKTREDFDEFFNSPEAKPILDELKKISEFKGNVYQVLYTAG